MRPDAADWLRLCLVPGIPAAAQRALLASFGAPGAAVDASAAAIAPIVGNAAATALRNGPDESLLSTTLDWLGLPGHHLVALGDEGYPRSLLEIPDPPTVFYAAGDLRFLNQPAIAIVGSRNATQQGLADARSFARTLSDAGYAIVSGLALGIDAAAHLGGLEGRSSTVAVVGTGPDRVYPAANRGLAHEIVARGVLVSEFALGTPPAASNFPRRNRLISGLARGVLVVEAALKSGSLTTARLALDQGRDVFAVPGSIHSPLSRGCHWLIKEGAKLVDCVEDIAGEIRNAVPSEQKPAELAEPADGEDPVLAALGHSPASLDVLVRRTGTAASLLASELTRLELAGRVERLPGGLFRQLAVP
jgi:DNA processing protein